MKAKDKTTGTFKEVYVKALDSLPVGSEIDFDGETTDIPAGWEEVDSFNLVGYTLYENATGSNGDITLNDSAANYDYIEIFYRNLDSFYTSTRMYNPNSKTVFLNVNFVAPDGLTIANQSKIVTINGNTITVNRYGEAKIAGGTPSNTASNYIYITKVIGYKEV